MENPYDPEITRPMEDESKKESDGEDPCKNPKMREISLSDPEMVEMQRSESEEEVRHEYSRKGAKAPRKFRLK